jgi:predicted nucleic acid-binding protein
MPSRKGIPAYTVLSEVLELPLVTADRRLAAAVGRPLVLGAAC